MHYSKITIRSDESAHNSRAPTRIKANWKEPEICKFMKKCDMFVN